MDFFLDSYGHQATMQQISNLRLATDIGGTFTDTVLVDQHNKVLATTKTATTPENPTIGALEGARFVLAKAGHGFRDVSVFIHGTTLATNALIERRGAVTACITTAGFRDILEIGYERRYSQYDINIQKPDYIVPRERCFTIPERVSFTGEVLLPLDVSNVDKLIGGLEESKARSVAICLLHSYANPEHEENLAAIIENRCPHISVSISSEVSPEAREFDRLCTTVANAYVRPMMATYLEEFSASFAHEGLQCPILMMTASGGMTTLETASRLPIRLVESGPAGGAILAARLARQFSCPEVLSFDMGGTTAKLCLIDGYQPQTARNFEISRAERFIKGSGMPVRIPVIEMIEIGAGGGSIASVDSMGRINVGPQSAGSKPGPAGFGKGGVEPTVTDADIFTGLIDPAVFAEGRISVSADLSRQSLEKQVAAPLGLNSLEAAAGVLEVVDENMAGAARMHASESGKNLGARTMVAFGGNGPLHATRIARKTGVSRILVPPDPGVGSALGFLHAPVAFEVVRSRYCLLDDLDREMIQPMFEEMIGQATEIVCAGDPDGEYLTKLSAFMRYRGQGHEIEIPLPTPRLSKGHVTSLRQSFENEYARQYSRAVPGMKIEVLNWAVTVSGVQAPVECPAPMGKFRLLEPERRQEIYCSISESFVEAGIFDRSHLGPGDELHGPALVQEAQTTTYVCRGFDLRVLADGTLEIFSQSKGFAPHG